ncbi:phosphoribosylamine--glycine ligase [Falsiroseomonas oryzae]|uniref:phosphoribosylamine--glycine ligase n=1 Tax=Falsiroseomonas oryzae TaxID=2766473 RepID=UPI0022EAEC6A|nr:phosphoribosylamine--glycine ligase [Roseomonas sp. MO-31]
MTRRLPLALLLPALLLAACGSRGPAPRTAAAQEDPAVAECRTESRNSPEVRELFREENPANQTQHALVEQRRTEAERRAFRDCLRRRGVIHGGGVEQVRPALFFGQ